MSELYELGSNLRQLLQGLLQVPPAPPGVGGGSEGGASKPIVWGKYVDPHGLSQLFKDEGAPRKHVLGQHPPAAIDNMGLKTTDVFHVPGKGTFTVDFTGYFQVTRSEPSTTDWGTATVYVNFTDLRLFGRHDKLGSITVDLNPNIVSAGNTFPAAEGLSSDQVGVAACAINVAARFHLTDLNMTLFNKTPIQLQNPAVRGIPTIGEEGKAGVYALPLYDWNDPDGNMVGYLRELRYGVQAYISKKEAMAYRASRTLAEFQSALAKS